ncbi:hypothetical protein MKY15_20550 [Sporosarcina sp. FSL K6-1540]|uniref:hypothetical protein n=1 Tax=Sporosarcina sp. FSL K6-1540 TaxID=2921555 RepID=UPI00315A2A47
MATGDLKKFGTATFSGTKQLNPTNPKGSGNIPSGSLATLNIVNSDADDAYLIRWIEVVDNDKLLHISDRAVASNVSWNELNAQGLIAGKNVTIDGKAYLLRVLSGGTSGRGSNNGAFPIGNEWDRIVGNESGYANLPTPTPTDLTNVVANEFGVHNRFWNWFRVWTWTDEWSRGWATANYFAANPHSYKDKETVWRPVLESVAIKKPNLSPNINGVYHKYSDGWVNINGTYRKIDSIHTNINGIWRKS